MQEMKVMHSRRSSHAHNWLSYNPLLLGDIFSFANNTGFMWENAPKFSAMVVFVEHRYYGESMPYGNKSFSVST